MRYVSGSCVNSSEQRDKGREDNNVRPALVIRNEPSGEKPAERDYKNERAAWREKLAPPTDKRC